MITKCFSNLSHEFSHLYLNSIMIYVFNLVVFDIQNQNDFYQFTRKFLKKYFDWSHRSAQANESECLIQGNLIKTHQKNCLTKRPLYKKYRLSDIISSRLTTKYMKTIERIIFFIGLGFLSCTQVYSQNDTTGIGDRVWLDMDGNGIQDPKEIGLNGININLFSDKDQNGIPDGVVIQSTVSSNHNSTSGYYHFENLETGYYVLQFVFSKQYYPTVFRAGSDATVDSDVQSLGYTSTIFYKSQTNDLSVDLGLVPKGTIGDFVWNDQDLDGIQDKNEPGINGFTIQLLNKNNVVVDQVISSYNLNTGEAGWYEFQSVSPGEYYIKIFPISNKGYKHSNPYAGKNDQLDSDITDQNGSNTTAIFTLGIGAYLSSIDAGYFLNNAIGNYVWRDINLNGMQDPNETGVNGVVISLFDAVSRNKIAETVSKINPYDGTNGFYYFNNLVAGSYYIQVSRPLLFYFTIPGIGSEDVDSDIDGSNGRWTSATMYISPNTNYLLCDVGLRNYSDEGFTAIATDELIGDDATALFIPTKSNNDAQHVISKSETIKTKVIDFNIVNKQIQIVNRPPLNAEFEMYDLTGRLIMRQSMPFDENIPNFFDLPLLSPEIYIIVGRVGNEKCSKTFYYGNN